MHVLLLVIDLLLTLFGGGCNINSTVASEGGAK